MYFFPRDPVHFLAQTWLLKQQRILCNSSILKLEIKVLSELCFHFRLQRRSLSHFCLPEAGGNMTVSTYAFRWLFFSYLHVSHLLIRRTIAFKTHQLSKYMMFSFPDLLLNYIHKDHIFKMKITFMYIQGLGYVYIWYVCGAWVQYDLL